MKIHSSKYKEIFIIDKLTCGIYTYCVCDTIEGLRCTIRELMFKRISIENLWRFYLYAVTCRYRVRFLAVMCIDFNRWAHIPWGNLLFDYMKRVLWKYGQNERWCIAGIRSRRKFRSYHFAYIALTKGPFIARMLFHLIHTQSLRQSRFFFLSFQLFPWFNFKWLLRVWIREIFKFVDVKSNVKFYNDILVNILSQYKLMS